MKSEVRLPSGQLIGLADEDWNWWGRTITVRMLNKLSPFPSKRDFSPLSIMTSAKDVVFEKTDFHWGFQGSTNVYRTLVLVSGKPSWLRGQPWFKEIKPFKRR